MKTLRNTWWRSLPTPPFSITEGGKQTYEFDGISASKYYYIEMKLSAPTSQGYVGIAHWADSENYFADTVSYVQSGNYNHAFSSTVGGVYRSSIEPAKYFEGDSLTGLTGANFGSTGMTVAALRMGNEIHTFINGKRVATYLIEENLAVRNTVPALYFNDNNGYYDGSIQDIVIVTGVSAASAKLSELTTGSAFGYANTPNWNKGVHTDATFNGNGFTYAYDSGVSYNDRRFVTGVNDRVFLAGNYYYQYEISGDMAFANGTNVYGLFYNWINTKSLTQSGYYKHEAIFCLKLNGDKLQRLTYTKGYKVNGDGLNTAGTGGDWVSNTTVYGGRNDLESDTNWQEAMKGGLIVRIERTVKNSTTDVYVISVTAKNNPELKLTSKPIEVSDATFGGYNWILYGTQSVDCTISNVTYGRK